jgi:multisubunit Na+/H+ antiporter MnhF subunit
MQNYTIHVSDNIPQTPPPRLLLIGYISQLLLYIVIIIYCILSPSLFSTIALLYMLISFAVTIATPYYVQKRT